MNQQERLALLRFIIAGAISVAVLVGCFWVILSPTTAADNVAAFALVSSVLAAWLVIVHRT